MAGDRQHFIPRFLQDGFLSHSTPKGGYTWVYRKDRDPYNPNTINVGVEGHFYTNGEDRVVDDSITSLEGKLSTVVNRLCQLPHGPVNDHAISDLIAHLEVRTRQLREVFLQAGNHIANGFIELVADDTAFIAWLEHKLRTDPSLLRDALLKQFQERGLPPTIVGPVEELAKQMLPLFFEQLRPHLPNLAAQLKAEIPAKLKAGVKDGHIKALKQSLAPSIRAEKYQMMTTSLVSMKPGELILGDGVVIFETTGRKRFKSFSEKGDNLVAFYLPLAHDRLLFGSMNPDASVPNDLSLIIAQCSLEYFIAREDSARNRELQKEIGKLAAPLSEAELDEIIHDNLRLPL